MRYLSAAGGLLLLGGCAPLGLTVPPVVVAGHATHRTLPVRHTEHHATEVSLTQSLDDGDPDQQKFVRMSLSDLGSDSFGANTQTRRRFGDVFVHAQERFTCPLVLVWGDEPVEMGPTPATNGFALDRPACGTPDWPSAATPWLVLDVDGNGSIDGGHELFGTATKLADGARARNGFAALAPLDTNGDGRIDADDAQWEALRLWRDADGDRQSSPEELTSLAASGIMGLPLQYDSDPRCDARGNCEIERASVDADTPVTLVDIHLRCR
ncbi:MAG: hypothetical protein JKY37_26045 [Nannocystaceae bacterium]|nr:hypothetical protein [Nannocystaceae bacterium]